MSNFWIACKVALEACCEISWSIYILSGFLERFNGVLNAKSLRKRCRGAKANNTIMCHSLILRVDDNIKDEAFVWSFLTCEPNGLDDQAFYALAMPFPW